MPELRLKLTAGTNVGLVRTNNEDNFVVCRNLISDNWTIPQAGETTDLGPYGALLVVADGMGGANAGEVASSIAIDTIQQAFSKQRLGNIVNSEEKILDFLCQVACDADKNIVKHSKKHKETKGMGTTLVMAWVLNDKAYICWCGDSRCYVFNPTVGLTRLSKDHSFVQQLVDRGELTPENAQFHPMSNIITQCLGNTSRQISPDTRVYKLSHDDVLLLCTDGLCGLCTDDEIVQVMAETDDVVAMKGRLIEEALKAGGYDNVTVVVCHVDAPQLQGHDVDENLDLKATLKPDAPAWEKTPDATMTEDMGQEGATMPEDEATPSGESPVPPAERAGAVPPTAECTALAEAPMPEPPQTAKAQEAEASVAAADDTSDGPHAKRRPGKVIGVLILLLACVLVAVAIHYADSLKSFAQLLWEYASKATYLLGKLLGGS